jgi:hypothetical protein
LPHFLLIEQAQLDLLGGRGDDPLFLVLQNAAHRIGFLSPAFDELRDRNFAKLGATLFQFG